MIIHPAVPLKILEEFLMETVMIKKQRPDGLTSKREILNLKIGNSGTRGKRRKRLKKLESTAPYSPPTTNYCFFTIISMGGKLMYAAIIQKNHEWQCLVPDCTLEKPGFYKFAKPNCENFIKTITFLQPNNEIFKKMIIKLYKVHIIGM